MKNFHNSEFPQITINQIPVDEKRRIFQQSGCDELNFKLYIDKGDSISARGRAQSWNHSKLGIYYFLTGITVSIFILIPLSIEILEVSLMLYYVLLIFCGSVFGNPLRDNFHRHFLRAGAYNVADGLNLADKYNYSVFLRDFTRDNEVVEALLSSSVDGIGPLVGIGDPKDALPASGAYRTYPSNDWHEVASDLIDRAKIVFLLGSNSAGISWEIHYLKSKGYLNKCVFLPTDFGHELSFNSDKLGAISRLFRSCLSIPFREIESERLRNRSSSELPSTRWEYLNLVDMTFSEANKKTPMTCDAFLFCENGSNLIGIEAIRAKSSSVNILLLAVVCHAVAVVHCRNKIALS